MAKKDSNRLYVTAYRSKNPLGGNLTTQMHLNNVSKLLHRDYSKRSIAQVFEGSNAYDNLYLLDGGIVVDHKFGVKRGFGFSLSYQTYKVTIKHESKKGLEKIAEEISLPSPSDESIRLKK